MSGEVESKPERIVKIGCSSPEESDYTVCRTVLSDDEVKNLIVEYASTLHYAACDEIGFMFSGDEEFWMFMKQHGVYPIPIDSTISVHGWATSDGSFVYDDLTRRVCSAISWDREDDDE